MTTVLLWVLEANKSTSRLVKVNDWNTAAEKKTAVYMQGESKKTPTISLLNVYAND